MNGDTYQSRTFFFDSLVINNHFIRVFITKTRKYKLHKAHCLINLFSVV